LHVNMPQRNKLTRLQLASLLLLIVQLAVFCVVSALPMLRGPGDHLGLRPTTSTTGHVLIISASCLVFVVPVASSFQLVVRKTLVRGAELSGLELLSNVVYEPLIRRRVV